MAYESYESSENYSAPPQQARRRLITTSNRLGTKKTTTEYLEHPLEPSLMKHQSYWRDLFVNETTYANPPIVRIALYDDYQIVWAQGAGTFGQKAWSELTKGRVCTAHLETRPVDTPDGRIALYAHVVTGIYAAPGQQGLDIPQDTRDLIGLVGATTNAADNLYLVIDGVRLLHDGSSVTQRLFAGDLEAYFAASDGRKSFHAPE